MAKLDATGTAMVYSTFLGGSLGEGGLSIAVGSGGNAYVTGSTNSLDFPTTADAFDRTGVGSAFVAKLNTTATELAYSTYIGGGGDTGYGIAVDATGNAYVTGITNSAGFPTTPAAFDKSYNGNIDAFIAKITFTGRGMSVRYPLGDGVSRPNVTGRFGGSATTVKKSYRGHLGENYSATEGTAVYPFAAGQVCKVGSHADFGKYVVIHHTLSGDINVHSIYAHLQQAKKSEGEDVTTDDEIALSGRTGSVSAAHLHFGILDNKRCALGKGYDGKEFPETTETRSSGGRTYFNPTIFIEKRK